MTKITPEVFFKNDEIKIDIFKKKYAKKGESVDECFHRIASEIADAGNIHGEDNAGYWTKRWTNELLSDMWRPGGSIIASTNNPDKKISTFNCTAFNIEEDSLESIYKTRADASKAAAHRQGSGVDFSNLRPRGSNINNAAEVSEGVISWMKSFDNIANEVGQRGRIPAILFSLNVKHPDIIEFIGCKDDINSINNANISVQITDEFMEAYKKDSDWTMEFKINDEETISRTIKARKLFGLIAKHAHMTAEPGIQFIDNMKRNSIQEALGYEIKSTNACSEKPLPPYGCCLLASINMAKVPKVGSEVFHSFIKNMTESMVLFLDSTVEYELVNSFKSPLDEQYEIASDLREIGLGITNLHKWLYDQCLEYGSEEGNDAVEEFFRYYFYYAFKASINLAKENGPCLAWERMKMRNSLKKNLTPFLENMFKEFPDLGKDYYNYGIRNGALLSVAPTGTLSLIFSDDCLSTGIEPLIGRYYWQRTRAVSRGKNYDYYFRLPKAIKDILLEDMEESAVTACNNKDINTETEICNDIEILRNIDGSVLDNNGKRGEAIITIINKYLKKDLLKTALEIDPIKKIDMMSRVQKYVDAAISTTFNLPEDCTSEDVRQIYSTAYEMGLKAVSVYREGCRKGVLLFEFPHTKKERDISLSEIDKKRPDNIVTQYAPKRPKSLPCEVFSVLKYKVLVGLFDDKPYEIFLIDTDKKLPGSGTIIKKNKRIYSFVDDEGNVIIENLIDKEIINDEINTITRLVSANLRHGTPIDFIIEQLKLCKDEGKYPKALSNVLDKYKIFILDVIDESLKCAICGELLVKHGGCMVCISCGGGKCSV